MSANIVSKIRENNNAFKSTHKPTSYYSTNKSNFTIFFNIFFEGAMRAGE